MVAAKQKRFGIILTIVAVAVLIVSGVVGWSVYFGKQALNNSAAQSTSQTPQQKQITSTPPNTNSQAQQVPVDPNAGYVVIKEWGVRFKVVAGLEGVEYAIKGTDMGMAIFSTEALAKHGENCGVGSNSREPLGEIKRSKTPLPSNEQLGQIGDYYYVHYGPETVCTDLGKPDDASTIQTQTLNSQFKPSIATLEAAK